MMLTRRPGFAVFAGTVVFACALWLASTVEIARAAQDTVQSPATSQTPIFRGGTILVPVDVAVLDRNGQPVTDLTRGDFTVLENGVPQAITAFSATPLVPEPPTPGAPPTINRSPVRPSASAPIDPSAPQRRRIFLIVLGYGRIDLPTKAFAATRQFIRTQLLPQDFVAVLAWDRVTDLTTDHEAVAGVVDRYIKVNDTITQQIDSLPPGADLTSSIQAAIDAVFAPTPFRSATDLIFGTPEARRENKGHDFVPWNKYMSAQGPSDAGRGARDNYLEESPRLYLGRQLPKIYAGLEYLRFVDGQKHLIVLQNGPNTVCAEGGLVSAGFAGCASEDDREFAARAADARVVVDIIHTDGTPVYRGAPRSLSAGSQISSPTFFFGAASAETVSERTGGQFLGTHYAAETFAKVDAATRFGYLLGYTPANATLDGRMRTIVVKVNRSGVTVLFRHGYHALPEPAPLDVQAVVTGVRRAAAASYDREYHDIGLTATATVVAPAGAGANAAVQVELNIDVSRLAFTIVDGRHTTGLDVTIYCGDAREHVVGQLRRTLDLKMSDETFERAKAHGLDDSARVPVTGAPKYVKVIVYDYGADLTGTAMITIGAKQAPNNE